MTTEQKQSQLVQFTSQMCFIHEGSKEMQVNASGLYDAYKNWAADEKLRPLAQPTFDCIISRWFPKKGQGKGARFCGLKL